MVFVNYTHQIIYTSIHPNLQEESLAKNQKSPFLHDFKFLHKCIFHQIKHLCYYMYMRNVHCAIHCRTYFFRYCRTYYLHLQVTLNAPTSISRSYSFPHGLNFLGGLSKFSLDLSNFRSLQVLAPSK